MLQQNIRVFLRSIVRHRLHFLITISGLILGLTVVLLAFTFIRDERGFDDFHQKGERIFRVNKVVREDSGARSKNAESPGLMAPTLQTDYPEVERATHVAPWFDEVLVSFEDTHVFTDQWLFADSNFLQLFNFDLIKGTDPARILSTPGQLLITPVFARSLFGDADPVGRVVKGVGEKDYVIAGLIQPAPRQSHLQYDVLASWASTESQSNFLDFGFMNNWLGQTVYTYVLLQQAGQRAAVEARLPDFTAKYMDNRKDSYAFFLQPLQDIYLGSGELLYLRGGKYGSAGFLRTFTIIALLILLIACFNYINITTAKSLQRAKEVGVKKVLGAEKGQLIGQFMTETFTVTLLAGVLALLCAQLLLPQLNAWFGKDILSTALLSVQSLGFITIIVALTSVIAGLFPSLLLTRFQALTVTRNTSPMTPGGEWPRQVLTTLQLTIGIALIASTLMLRQQFNYMLNKDLGFDKEQVMVMHTPPGIVENAAAFRNELAALPGVQSVSMCGAAVESGTFGSTVIPEGYNDQEMMVQMFRVDSNYLYTFGLDMAEGRFLNRSSDFEPGSMVVNEAFVRQVGWDEALGKTLRFPGDEEIYPVVGVVKDFNFTSLHQSINPLVMYLSERKAHTSVRLDPGQLSGLLPQIQLLWERFDSRFPFDYYFLDDYFAEKYLAERQMLRVITLFAFLAIFIACLGLYGLASFAIARRTKEIGIRKVLGATVTSIIGLLSRGFLKLVGIAFLIATPFSLYFTDSWLENFAYQVGLQWWVFAVAGGLVLLLAFLTIGFQSLRAAYTNPVESLRNE